MLRALRIFKLHRHAVRTHQELQYYCVKKNEALVSCSCIFDVLARDADAIMAGKLGTFKKRKFLKILIMKVAVNVKEAQRIRMRQLPHSYI